MPFHPKLPNLFLDELLIRTVTDNVPPDFTALFEHKLTYGRNIIKVFSLVKRPTEQMVLQPSLLSSSAETSSIAACSRINSGERIFSTVTAFILYCGYCFKKILVHSCDTLTI